MLKLVFLFTVTAITVLPIGEVESKTRRKADIDGIIDLIQQENHNYLPQKSDDIANDGSSLVEFREADDEDISHYGSLTSREIVELIRQATRNTNNNKHKLYGKSYRPVHHDHLGRNDYYKKKSKLTNNANGANLEKLFYYYGIQRPSQQSDRYRERRYPNKRIKGFNTNKMRSNVLENLDDYSKLYIILNPLAIQKSKSKDSLSNLITKVLPLSNRYNQRHEQKKEYYKGFPVMSDLLSRRSRRDSRESFGPKDSMEDNYKQKRSRNDHGGGGGSGGGRTAIPYIRQRGDIYERDN